MKEKKITAIRFGTIVTALTKKANGWWKAAFNAIMSNHSALLGGGSFEVIIHRAGTNTGGPHLHMGNYADGRGTHYKSEVGGRYTRVAT